MDFIKSSKLFVLSGILCMGLCACNNDGNEVNGVPIRLTGHIDVASRGTDLEQQSTELVVGEKVGITILDAANEHTNCSWEAGEKGVLTNEDDPVSWGEKEITIYGYHPYNPDWKELDKDVYFSVSNDQSTDAGYLASDLLWTNVAAMQYESPVILSFTHKLAKINITLASEEIDDLSGATISVCGTNIATMFNPMSGLLSSATESVEDIKAGVTTTEFLTSACIIIPQTVSEGTSFIKVEHKDKTYTYKLQSSITFDGGKAYTFNLEIVNGALGQVTGTGSDIPWM